MFSGFGFSTFKILGFHVEIFMVACWNQLVSEGFNIVLFVCVLPVFVLLRV